MKGEEGRELKRAKLLRFRESEDEKPGNGRSAVFEADLSARLMVKTFNGDLYTDFPTTYLRELPPIHLAHRYGKKVYKSSGGSYRAKVDRTFHGTVNGGGPEMSFTTFNGDIFVRKAAQ